MNKKTPNFTEVLRQGQIQVTKISKKLDSITEEDIVPVKNRKGRASGVRCPYYKITLCEKDLAQYTVPYEKILKRWH